MCGLRSAKGRCKGISPCSVKGMCKASQCIVLYIHRAAPHEGGPAACVGATGSQWAVLYTHGRAALVYGESRPAVWYGEPVTRERAPLACVTGSRPTREGAAVPRTREPPHTQGPRHTGATPRTAAPHATPVGEGRPVMRRALSHTNRGAPCHANGLSLWCGAKPTHACHATHGVSRLCGGPSPTHMGVSFALLYECKAPLV